MNADGHLHGCYPGDTQGAMSIIEAIRAAKVGDTVWDDGERASVKGLHFRRRSESAQSFYVYYRSRGGMQRRPKVGSYPEITIYEARKRAKAILDQVKTGADPKGDWDKQKNEPTVSDLWDYAVKTYYSRDRFQDSNWSKTVANIYKNHVEGPFGNKRVSSISSADIRRWYAGYEKSRTRSGNIALALITTLYKVAAEGGFIDESVQCPTRLVRKYPAKKRSRYASLDEIKRLLDALRNAGPLGTSGAIFLEVMLLTGARSISLRRAEWSQLKPRIVGGQRYGVFRFSGKMTNADGKADEVIFPPRAMNLLDGLASAKDKSGKIFDHGIPKKLWERVRLEIGAPDLWARDLRRSFATVALGEGASIGHIAELLNHRSTQTTKIYAKLADEAAFKVVDKVAAKIDSLRK